MLNLSLAIAVLSASTAVTPLTHLPHLHTHLPAVDTRVAVLLENKAPGFVEVMVGGQAYTVLSHHDLTIKAPVGTTIIAGSTSYSLHRGQVIATLDAGMNGSHILVR